MCLITFSKNIIRYFLWKCCAVELAPSGRRRSGGQKYLNILVTPFPILVICFPLVCRWQSRKNRCHNADDKLKFHVVCQKWIIEIGAREIEYDLHLWPTYKRGTLEYSMEWNRKYPLSQIITSEFVSKLTLDCSLNASLGWRLPSPAHDRISEEKLVELFLCDC